MAEIVRSSDFSRPGFAIKGAQFLRLMQKRNLYWSWYEPRNFGDWIGPYLYQAMLGHMPFYLKRSHHNLGDCFFTVGSILRRIHVPDKAIVWGSGIISAADEIARPKSVLAVRGPRSRQRLMELGYSCPEIFGDPAILLSEYYKPKTKPISGLVGLIPHFFDYEIVKSTSPQDVFVINVAKPVDEVIDDIAKCELTLSSSLHGLIVSHTYNVPTVWIRSINKLVGDDCKFHDHFEAIGIGNIAPTEISYTSSSKELCRYSEVATLADLSVLRTNLLGCCPFTRGSS